MKKKKNTSFSKQHDEKQSLPQNKKNTRKGSALLPCQKTFLEKIREFIPAPYSLPGILTEVLNISTDAAYRRIRCETEMNIEEMYALCRFLSLSADSLLFQETESATFRYISIIENTKNFEKYLNNIREHLGSIVSYHEQHPGNIMLYYAAEEIPIFESLYNEVMVPFKLFYWLRNVLNTPELQHKKFDFNEVPRPLLEISLDLYKKYKTLPSTEIWSNETVLTFIKQMEFCLETGLFRRKEDAMKLMDAHFEMINELWKMAEMSYKYPRRDVPFYLYHCEVMIGTNCIVIEKDQNPHTAFISFNTLNSLSTSNEVFCHETYLWLKNIIKKSTLISGTSEKERYKFFNEMIKKSEMLRARISDAVYFEDKK